MSAFRIFLSIFVFFNLQAFVAEATPLGEKALNSGVKSKVAQNPRQKIQIKNFHSSLGANYSVREIKDEFRSLKEFINSEGVVFAITWDGIGGPDFAEIFGSYYSEYQSSLKNRPRGRSRNRFALNNPDFVVNNIGHGSWMKGLAFVPSLLPPGVAQGDLK